MKRFRAAIVGCGRIAGDFDRTVPTRQALSHAGAYHVNRLTTLVAAAEPDEARRNAFARKWSVPAVYPSVGRMLQNERIDILSVATGPASHWPVIREACRYPLKAIYCEKPIAENVSDARKIIRACRKNGTLLIVNHQRRFGGFFRQLRDRLSDGSLGRVRHVNCLYTRGIFNTGTHLVDLFTFLFGSVRSVDARPSRQSSHFPNDPNLDAALRFAGGLELTMKACDDHDYLILEIDILTTRARIRMGEELEFFKAVPGKNLLKKNELVRSRPPFGAAYPRYGMVGLERGVSHITDCIRGKEEPISTGESAARTLSVLQAMLRSAKQKRRS